MSKINLREQILVKECDALWKKKKKVNGNESDHSEAQNNTERIIDDEQCRDGINKSKKTPLKNQFVPRQASLRLSLCSFGLWIQPA